MERIKVCVIGTGRAGMVHAQNFAHCVPHAQLAALVDSREEILIKSGRELNVETCYRDYREALKGDAIGAVVVATPTKYHCEIVVAAAKAGKHILCEKPMAMTVAECRQMLLAAEENKVKIQIGFIRRFDNSFQAAKEAINRGEIGNVVLVKSLTRGPSIPQRWQYDVKASNGPLAEVNSHDIDTLRWFTDSEFAEVYAIAGNYRCPETGEEFPDFYDNVSLLARFENGMQGFMDGAVSVGYGYDARVEVLGTIGVIFIGQLAEGSMVTCSTKKGIFRPYVKSWRNLFREAYSKEDRDFIQSILEDRLPRVTGLDGMMAVKVVDAGNRSIQEGRPVSLRET